MLILFFNDLPEKSVILEKNEYALISRMLAREASSGWVFGCIQRGTPKIRLFQVETRDAQTLLNLIGENIERGSIIVTDGWAAYPNIRTTNGDFQRLWVNHRLNFVSPNDSRAHTQRGD